MGIPIQNKTVLVTGANRGIGRAIVEEAIHRGAAKVYAAVRKLESANSLVEEFGERVVPIRVDLEDPASITTAAQEATDVDVVINNAGVLKTASAVDEHAIESLQYEFEVNVLGLVRIAQAFAPVLKANGGGALAQLNSVASIKSFADVATYSASKAASYSLTQGLRDSLRAQGTLVVSVHPGPIQTDMADHAGFTEIAEPPALVATAVFDAIADGEFHVWPDSMAKQFGGAYQSFAENVVNAEMNENPV
ncbi:SDR family oxidoreductase [Aporhodopirellula aestuarii]|uniref:SDR family oxidoreductase n=1 Tax=Aporhodopirellula aestuarii TaxID=2950107 RepID=A0ABT0U2D9_9BACT|nr:SDR family oxidoreductase [Aporhodopirellula aestuarii]MCM2371025.1 SDR family oxidoreductase [Aporhodopirellula aestuarii]